jgi:transposase
MLPSETYTNERLDYLGIVAGVYQEIGLASYLDVHAGNRLQQMSIGTATVGMILNGLGWSLRRLYLVPQFFTNKAVEHLLGQGMTAEKLNDDCLRHTLDWLYENKPTTFFACIAPQVCKMIGIQARHVFLKDQLLLASSLFLKKPEQIVALDLIMVLCLLVFRLAEHRLRVWLTETGDHSQLDQLANRDSYHSALVFPCFEGIELLRAHAALTPSIVLRLQPLYVQVLAFLDLPYQHIYNIPLSG